MPPSRRRPVVPTTPTTRPRVAGLRKRPDPGSAPETTAANARAGTTPVGNPSVEGTQAENTHVENTPVENTQPGSTRAETLPSDRDLIRPTEVTGLIEPREDVDDTGDTAPDTAPEAAPRPRPTGRRKRTGEAVAPSVLADPEPVHAESDDDWVARHTDDRTGSGLVLPIGLVVLAALLVGLGVWFQAQAGGVRYNQALVDSAGTTEVAGQTREAVEKAFSYNYADVSATEKAANELLVGKAQCQYNAIFGPVRALAPEQKLVVTVKAVSSGVTSLDGDRATVLLFLDQVTTRTTDNQSGGGIAMMRVGALKVDDRWKVDNMEMFGQNGDQAAETAKC